MIVSIFDCLKDVQDQQEAESILVGIGRLEMFEKLIPEYENWWAVAKYIILAYSYSSSLLEVGENWEATRRRIAHIAGVPKDDRIEDILWLKKEAVWRTVDEYLTYQGSREFRHLTVLKNLYERMLSSTMNDEVDYDQQYKNAGYATRIWEQIGEYEQAVSQKFGVGWTKIKEDTLNVIEKKKKSTGLSLEASDLVKI